MRVTPGMASSPPPAHRHRPLMPGQPRAFLHPPRGGPVSRLTARARREPAAGPADARGAARSV